LFEAAIDGEAVVLPVALRYINATTGEHCQVAAFVGDIGFVESLHKVMRAPSITVNLSMGEPVSSQGHSRRTLAQLCHRSVSAQLEALSATTR
jgi:1-acyl-sn-glycerol-3-phosphate acyltransferase